MKALLLVDIENDFLPGGALEVKNSDKILPIVNDLLNQKFDLIVASKDWHPKGHISFADTHNKMPGEIINGQILWPIHCVQDSFGSEFSPKLNHKLIDKIFFKGVDPIIDSYSAFFDNEHQKSTGLDEYLKSKNIKELYITGLATDYCVKYSVLDALKLGYKTYVIKDGCYGIDLNPLDSINAIEQMQRAGAHIVNASQCPI